MYISRKNGSIIYLVRDLSKPGSKTYLSADVIFFENQFPYQSKLVSRPIENIDSDDDQNYTEEDFPNYEDRCKVPSTMVPYSL